MASIQQAAKWMKEGKKVRRPSFQDKEYFWANDFSFIKYETGEWVDMLEIEDLLAEDWEILTWVN